MRIFGAAMLRLNRLGAAERINNGETFGLDLAFVARCEKLGDEAAAGFTLFATP